MPPETSGADATPATSLGDELVKRGLLAPDDLRRASEMERRRGGGLGRMLGDLGFVHPADLLAVQSERLGIPVVRSADFPSELPFHERLSAGFLRRHRCLPLGGSPVLSVAVADPLDLETLASLRTLVGMPVEPALSTEREILDAIDLFYGPAATETPSRREAAQLDDLQDTASDVPVIRYVNSMVARALEERASDVHLEPLETGFRVRFRIDGLLEERQAPPAGLRTPVVSRLKLMAGLDIAEHRLPQDGRSQVRALGRDIDLRVATLPTLHGESVTIRLLDPSVASGFDLPALGLGERLLGNLTRIAELPHGLVLVTGPTGSGKTTTLHAALRHVSRVACKVITIEDPVEYRLEGVSQIQVRPAVGLTFATGLRHIVRQDPDVIMVGEIRDGETAAVAVRAALTGHTVFSTLHTNDAVGAVTRLVDMGIEPYLLATSLSGVLAQRLVRRLCSHCRRPRDPVAAPDGHWAANWVPRGCDACRGQGYSGRIGIFSLLQMDDRVRRLTARNDGEAALLEAAHQRGMRSLADDGWEKIERGLTSVEEVVRATQDD